METQSPNKEFLTPENLELNLGESTIPDKMFFKIGEVAQIADLKPYVLRFWETEFKELAPEKAVNNQRKYSKDKIKTLLLIKKLLYDDKYTIDGAKQKLKEIKEGKDFDLNKFTNKQKEFKNTLEHIKTKLIKIQEDILEFNPEIALLKEQ